MKFQKILMTECRDMDKKHQKCPQNGVFPQSLTPKILFKNPDLSLLYPYGALTSCKKLEKLMDGLETFKEGSQTDGLQMD